MKGEELDHWEYGLSVARQMVCGVCFLYFVSESIFSILFHVMIYFDLDAIRVSISEGDSLLCCCRCSLWFHRFFYLRLSIFHIVFLFVL